jgi:hypothetical protein
MNPERTGYLQVSNADLLLFESDTAMSNAAFCETRVSNGRTELVRLLSGQPLAEFSATSHLIHRHVPLDQVESQDINRLALQHRQPWTYLLVLCVLRSW